MVDDVAILQHFKYIYDTSTIVVVLCYIGVIADLFTNCLAINKWG
jgi:hypothetical protein